jgi:serine/threonine protein kinase
MARLLRRAQAVARLRHPNLVRMLPLPGGAGLSPVLGNARRLADFTLPAGTFKRFDLEQVVRLLLDVLSGVAALHEVETDGQAFVHGQISPQHIYIDEHGTARLVPLLNSTKVEDTGYTAPERLAAGAVDARADVFSVGVMLWEALSGRRLYPDGFAERLPGALPPPIRLSPDARWAQALCSLAEQAIAPEPAARFTSALELSNALAAAAAQQLSRVDTDAWQEEAPTPVFQPRLHLATLRTTTPPPSVVTIAPEATPVAFEAAPSTVANDEASFEAPVQRRWGRTAVLGIALISLSAAGFGLWKSPRSWQSARSASQLMATPLVVAPAVVPSVVEAPVVPPLVEAPVAPLAPILIAAPPVASLAAGPLAVPSASVSAAASVPAKMPAAKPKRKAPRVHVDDYGI